MRRRSGFTLIETIVTVGIIAVLAAFVVPTVIQKAGVGDPVKVQNDLTTVRTGLETFATDSKAGFPQLLYSLTATPADTNRLIDSTKISDGEIAKWNGPYIGATITAKTKDSIATGYTAYLMNFVHRYDLADNVPEHDSTGASNAPTFKSTNTLFAAVEIHGLTWAQATALNTLIDGAGDVNVASDSSNITGRLRFTAPVSGLVKQAYYLASPITQ
jgi:prepilin-type N-terminal cleavage/methylation domain-containing protein